MSMKYVRRNIRRSGEAWRSSVVQWGDDWIASIARDNLQRDKQRAYPREVRCERRTLKLHPTWAIEYPVGHRPTSKERVRDRMSNLYGILRECITYAAEITG